MLRFFPESALVQLEFEKVRELLTAHCRTAWAKDRVAQLRIHTKKEYIDLELNQTNEYKQILQSGQYFPNDFITNIEREIKLLSIPGATLSGEQFILVRKLAENASNIFRWLDGERRAMYPALTTVVNGTYYEKVIISCIDDVLDDFGNVRDNASPELMQIRQSLHRKRQELRRVFDKLVSRMNKQGYLADIEESFINGRRVLAVYAEQKRQIRGILHGESDSRRTSFIEPEETTELNNDVFSLEQDEHREVQRLLQELTARLFQYAPLLRKYLTIAGIYDFIQAKAKWAIELNAAMPLVHDRSLVRLKQAYHPLLYLYNAKSGKTTYPVDIELDDQQRILVISGPNAGGKTVTMKTVGLIQLMLQSGLLVPVHPDSEMGIFKQVLIHIGDTQSLEYELSTYSAHLLHMKHFMENANGRTLFFIDELGSGSDPALGGAFAEVIMEELARKHAIGIVTTHYLNLKVMASKVHGVINGAMQFDEASLLPLYRLVVGKPGSSYTFSIAERIGLEKRLINRARKLVDENQFMLDKLLNQTEQELLRLQKERQEMTRLVQENQRLKKEMEQTLNRERHQQETERLKLRNKLTDEKLNQLRDLERKIKALVVEWRKTENKDQVIKSMQSLLFVQKEKMVTEKQQKKWNEKFVDIGGEVTVGAKVKLLRNRQVGQVREIRGKKAVVQVGMLPITVDLSDLTVVEERNSEENSV